MVATIRAVVGNILGEAHSRDCTEGMGYMDMCSNKAVVVDTVELGLMVDNGDDDSYTTTPYNK